MFDGFSLAALVAATIGFLVSSVAGSGGVLLLIPVLATRIPIYEATAFATLPMLANNLSKLAFMRADVDWRLGGKMLLWAAPAGAVASWLASGVPQPPLKIGLALVTLLSLLRAKQTSPPSWALPLSSMGIGLLSGLLGSAGPAAPAGLRLQGVEGARFVSTMALLGAGLQLARLPAYGLRAQVPGALWPLWVVTCLIAAVAPLLGVKLQRKLDVAQSRRIVDSMIVVSAVALLAGALR